MMKFTETVGVKVASIGDSAFKKCGQGIKFKVPNKKLEDYKKLLKGKY